MIEDRSPADEYREIAGRFGRVVDGIEGDAWDRPSPVPGWAARDVVRHLVVWFPAFLASGADLTLPRGPSPDDDPAGAWRVFSDGVQAVLDDPATADRTLANPHIGEMGVPAAIAQFFTADVFMHTWDLARATGQDATLDAERCAVMLEGMAHYEEAMRSSGQYGPRIDVPADADVQSRFLAFIGRDPR